MNDRVALLPLQDAVLRRIAERGGVKRYPAHAVIIHESDDSDALFIILAGRVKVYAANDAGKEVILTTLGPGEYVGELALDGGARSASVMTLEPTTCAVVAGANLRAGRVADQAFRPGAGGQHAGALIGVKRQPAIVTDAHAQKLAARLAFSARWPVERRCTALCARRRNAALRRIDEGSHEEQKGDKGRHRIARQ